MKILKSEKGNTLVITIFVLVMASVIGLTLMSMSMNGTKRNEHRENYSQAVEQAEKGIKHITLQIQKKLEDGINDSSINIDNGDSIVNLYDCDTGKSISFNDTEKNLQYKVCAKNIHTTSDPDLEGLKATTSATFVSTGTANGETKVVESDYEFIITNYPGFLNYAVSTHSNGNLILNGGIDIKGDVRADENFIITDSSYIPKKCGTLNSKVCPWVENKLPSITSYVSENDEATLYVNKNKKLFLNKGGIPEGSSDPKNVNPADPELQLSLDALRLLNLDLKLFNLSDILQKYKAISYYELAHFNYDDYIKDYKPNKKNNLFELQDVTKPNEYLSKGYPYVEEALNFSTVDVKKIISDAENCIKTTPSIPDGFSECNKIDTDGNNYPIYKEWVLLVKLPAILNGDNNKPGENFKLTKGIQTAPYKSKTYTVRGNYFVDQHSIIANSKYNIDGNFYFDDSLLSLYDGENNLNGTFYIKNDGVGIVKDTVGGLLGSLLGDLGNLLGDVLGSIVDIKIEQSSLQITKGKQSLNGTYYISGAKKQENPLINVDLSLGSSGNAMKINGVKNGQSHTIKGTYYIDGDVLIKDTKIFADAVFYVNGDVAISNTNIDGNLVIFANGDITLNYASKLKTDNEGNYKNSIINGYLYSNGKIEIHGTENKSQIQINGGVAAKRLLLSGFDVGGKTKTDSRLKIYYDEDVIKTYAKNTTNYKQPEIILEPVRETGRTVK